jgi:hypothetical protein
MVNKMPRKKAKNKCKELCCQRPISKVDPNYCRYHTPNQKEAIKKTQERRRFLLSQPKVPNLQPFEPGYVWERKKVANCPLCWSLLTDKRICPTPEKHMCKAHG